MSNSGYVSTVNRRYYNIAGFGLFSRDENQLNMDRLRVISLIIAAVYVVVFSTMFVREATCSNPCAEEIFEGVLAAIFWLAASLMCIWRGDELGECMTGFGSTFAGRSPNQALDRP